MNTGSSNSVVRRRIVGRSTTLSVAIVLCSILLLVGFGAAKVLAEKTVTWERFDVTLDLRDDGSYHITEDQQILFEGGTFSGGFATISLDRIDDIGNIELSEVDGTNTIAYQYVPWSAYEEDPRTFSYRLSNSDIEINWGFPETEDESRTFVLEYDVVGALRVYGTDPDVRQQIWWTAISTDVTDVAPVEESTITVNLPRPVDLNTVLLGVDAEERAADHTADGKTWVWEESNLRAGDDFIIRLEFPKLVDAPVPSWQDADDTSRLEEEKEDDRQALYDLTFIGIGFLVLIGGGISLLGLWFSRGRDPNVGAVADFLPAPPDDLPPGAAGALLDEVAHERDIVATVVDLGRRGVLKIDEQSKEETGIFPGARDFSLTLVNADAEITPFERSLVKSLFPGNAKDSGSIKLSAARSGFSRSAESIKEQMYQELVTRGYFASSPEATRKNWRRSSIIALVTIVAAALIAGFIADRSAFVYFPIVIAGLLALCLMWMSDVLPKKTLKGAEASAKWNAFKRYLGDIEKYDKLAESQQIFDKYLPYAVAFGLEESWVRKFSAAGAAPPAWYGPVIISGPRDWSERPYRGGHTYGGGSTIFPSSGGSGRSSGDGGGFDMPSLQEMSDSAGKSLQGSSNSFFDMLTSAAKAFGDMSSSGGGSSRRHWGGGGGGFRGGGSRGGSSGGGKRGFN